MATPNPTGRIWQRRKAKRLRKRIARLEGDRVRLTAYLHFKQGKGDPRYLNCRLRRALRRTASGVLLERIENESGRLRDQLSEREAGES